MKLKSTEEPILWYDLLKNIFLFVTAVKYTHVHRQLTNIQLNCCWLVKRQHSTDILYNTKLKTSLYKLLNKHPCALPSGGTDRVSSEEPAVLVSVKTLGPAQQHTHSLEYIVHSYLCTFSLLQKEKQTC